MSTVLKTNLSKSTAEIHETTSTTSSPITNNDGTSYALKPTSSTRPTMPDSLRSLTPKERQRLETKLRRKIDIRLLPMIVLIYIMNYLDRNNIASARLAGLEKDLKLHGDQFQLSVSILFVGYLLMQVPSNMVLNKLGKPSLYLPTFMIVWGVISGLTAACTTFGGLLACRFLLGFVEAAYFVSVIDIQNPQTMCSDWVFFLCGKHKDGC
jgi:Major Facilitator Superfamily